MKDTPNTFGISDTLPPLGFREVKNWLWLGFTGLLLLALGFFPHLVPPPWGGLVVLACWLALPVRGFFVRKAFTDTQKRISAQVRLYTLIVIGFGVGFTIWARHLGLSWPIVIGTLFFMEALPSLIVSLTEWWRVSAVGLSLGLIVCGLGFPFAHGSRMGVLLGASVFSGSILSAGILYWQVRRHRTSPNRLEPTGVGAVNFRLAGNATARRWFGFWPLGGTNSLMNAKDLFLRYIKAYNDKDVTTMLTFFDEGCVFENISGGKATVRTEGKAALQTLAERSADAFATREQRVTSLTEGQGRIVAEIDYHGVLRADLSPELKAGSQLNLRGASVCEVSGGKIVRLSDYS